MTTGPLVSIDDVTCKYGTTKAILVEIEGDEYWIPQSHVSEDSEVWQAGHEGTLVITEWIARQNDLLV